MNGKVLIYYAYTNITYPKRIAKWQRKICQELGLTGRILIAHEGINGTVAGSTNATERYKEIMHAYPPFHALVFKESSGGTSCFEGLKVTTKKEIIGLKAPEGTARIENAGQHLTPDEVHALLQNKPNNLVILDTRNTYEHAIGRFKDSILPDINNFREFPDYIDKNLALFKDKDVLMYCTAGIRCERATAYLHEKKVAKNIYQINGGIHTYVEKHPDGFFRGKNYVFDNRIALKVNDDILGVCFICSQACDDYLNCLNAKCNKHFICCASCKDIYQETCSSTCQRLVDSGQTPKRPAFHKIVLDPSSLTK